MQYQCIGKTKKQSDPTVNRLVCDLDPITNRLGWIIDADELLDPDDRVPAFQDQFTGDVRRNKTTEIRTKSVRFLQCNDRKLILFGF